MAAWDSRCGADVQARLRGFGSLQDAFRIQFVGVEVSELARSLSAANLSASASQAASGWKGGRVQLNRGGGRIAKARSNSSNFRNVFFSGLALGARNLHESKLPAKHPRERTRVRGGVARNNFEQALFQGAVEPSGGVPGATTVCCNDGIRLR